MTEPTTLVRRRYRRTRAEYCWTGRKVEAFLRNLIETVSVTKAARSVGMSRQSAYRLRERSGHAFAELWDQCLALGRERRWLSAR